MEAGTVTTDLFLANSVARREGWAGGLGVQETLGEEVVLEGERVVVIVAGVGSVEFLCSFSSLDSFLEVMVMD